MDLSPEQTQLLREMLDVFTTDTLYTLLLGLDGSAALGGDQRHYTLLDEDGSVIAEEGDLEAAAHAWSTKTDRRSRGVEGALRHMT